MLRLPKLLSKTKLLRGYRCLKYIYLTVHHPELEAPVTDEQQALFDQGNRVGELARERFPGGVLVENDPWDFIGSLNATREHLKNGSHTVYEAAFEFDGCYARADIIRLNSASKRWTIIEVKSSTKVKPEHLDDVALQAWMIAKGGLPIERISVLHLNPECRFPDLTKLFVESDATESSRAAYPGVHQRVNEISNVLKKEAPPDVDIGPHCLAPNECGFKDHCWKEKKIPQVSVLDLPQIKDKKWDLYRNGVIELSDPRLTDLTLVQQRMIDAHKNGKRFIDATGIRNALAAWKFPLIFLDFETINPAIPRFNGCSPYSQTPFQFSVHVLTAIGGDPLHTEYLHDDTTDPRPKLIPTLLAACGEVGSVVSYYSRFESDRIKEMASVFPEWSDKLMALTARLVDPLDVVRNCVYDSGFAGSFSLKVVVPALLGAEFSYHEMSVPDGTAAQRAFEEMISDATTAERKSWLKNAMLDYCRKDTLVMVELVKWLHASANSSTIR